MKTCLTIAGSDCTGGAGIQADLKTFSALGVFGMSAIVSVVAENTCRVLSIWDLPPESIRDQLDAVFEDMPVDGVKVGMLSHAAQMEAVAEKLRQYRPPFAVVDPVMVAKGGCALLDPAALDTLRREIVPLAALLTPNLPEAEALVGRKLPTGEDRRAACVELGKMGAGAVLLKGGHLEGEPRDLLWDGEHFHVFPGVRIHTLHTHGTGCTLSSAVAAHLARGFSLPQAVETSKEYVTEAIRRAPGLGRGHGPVHHFHPY